MPHALVVDDHAETLVSLADLVEREGFGVSHASSLQTARQELQATPPDVIILDLHLPDGEGMALLDELDPLSAPAVVLITGQATVSTAVAALRRGVSDYLTKPLDFNRLRAILAEVVETRGLKQEIGAHRSSMEQRGSFGLLVGTAPSMQAVYDQISRVAPTSATVLVVGESGTGKELVARTLHDFSRRRKGPFVALNCGAISPNIIESELFGHERGAFTGAERRHKGVFEQAMGGTLFLDEITEMPMDLQVKLLRVLETGEFMRTGGEVPLSINVRFIAATNRSPEEAVTQGRLRDDLYYRLKVFQLSLPTLRERAEDIPLLADRFLRQICETEGAKKHLVPGAVDMLRAYGWPGNVRELKNAVYSAYIMSGDSLTPDAFPSEVRDPAQLPVTSSGHLVPVHVGMTLADVERRFIVATLSQLDGSKTKTAGTLGISLKTLYTRLKEYRQ